MSLKENNQSSLIRKKELLDKIIDSPSEYRENDEIIKALSSQSALAKFSDDSLGLSSCSLNTFKSNAELLLNDGFSELDDLRVIAKSIIDDREATTSASTGSRADLQNKNKVLTEQVNGLRQDNIFLSVIVSELRGELKRFAVTSDKPNSNLMVDYERVNKKITAKLSLINKAADRVAMDIPLELVDSFKLQIDEYLNRS